MPVAAFAYKHNEETVGGVGHLVWLNSTKGLLANEKVGLIGFEIKDFCDQAVTDLTSVLRIGFVLKFQALQNNAQTNSLSELKWNASFVAPLLTQDFRLAPQVALSLMVNQLARNVDNAQATVPYLEDPSYTCDPPYRIEMEKVALPFILTMFQSNQQAKLPLNTLHTSISNSCKQELYHYIGKSSIKRRQFLERRSHIFQFGGETVHLVSPSLHVTVLLLASHLITRGGAMPLQELFDFYIGCPDIPLEARDLIGEGKNRFLQFLDSHPWVYSVFPSRVFVSIRRKLVDFSYPQICAEGIIDQDVLNLMASHHQVPANGVQNGSIPPHLAAQLARQQHGFGSHGFPLTTSLQQALKMTLPPLNTSKVSPPLPKSRFLHQQQLPHGKSNEQLTVACANQLMNTWPPHHNASTSFAGGLTPNSQTSSQRTSPVPTPQTVLAGMINIMTNGQQGKASGEKMIVTQRAIAQALGIQFCDSAVQTEPENPCLSVVTNDKQQQESGRLMAAETQTNDLASSGDEELVILPVGKADTIVMSPKVPVTAATVTHHTTSMELEMNTAMASLLTNRSASSGDSTSSSKSSSSGTSSHFGGLGYPSPLVQGLLGAAGSDGGGSTNNNNHHADPWGCGINSLGLLSSADMPSAVSCWDYNAEGSKRGFASFGRP